MRTLSRSLCWLLLLSMAQVGCETEEAATTTEAETTTMHKIGEESVADLRVEMFADAPLHVGLNRVYYKVHDTKTDTAMKTAAVTHAPLMTMKTKTHACPLSQPVTPANNDGYFVGDLVFTMASGKMGTWENAVTVAGVDGSNPQTVTFADIAVAETHMKKDFMVMEADGTKTMYIVTLNGVDEPKVGVPDGLNPFTLTVAKKATMMSFPAVSDLEITVDPQMPSMNHGSAGNVNPTHASKGQYKGTLSFAMTGQWEVTFTFSRAGKMLGTVMYTFDL